MVFEVVAEEQAMNKVYKRKVYSNKHGEVLSKLRFFPFM